MKPRIATLGWSVGKDARGDDTGVWHRLVTRREGEHDVARAACNPRVRVGGQVERAPCGNTCQRCACRGA